MIAHLLLYSNKFSYISHQDFPCKFLFLFLCQTNIQQVKIYGVA